MRRLALPAALAVLSAACFAPLPCTQALCPSKVDGSYRVTGWNRSVTSSADGPQVPVVSDSAVEVLGGRVEFVNRRTVIAAAEGTSFRFAVSTDSARTPVVEVSSGSLSVSAAPAPATTVLPGAPYFLRVEP